MANDIKEISDIVKKCKILLLDIEGTTTSISFVKDKLFPYAEENVKQFLDSQWETDDVKEAVAALRKLALEDQEKNVDGAVAIPGEDASKEDQIAGLVSNVKWQMSSDRKVGALKLLQGLIWKQGYDSGAIKGHVYDDVSAALEQWHSVEGQKVYIYSSGSVQAQKLLFGQSQAGDLLPFIDGHFDTAVGAKQEASSYTAIAEKIGVEPKDVLFLTDIPKEGEAASLAGFHVALVSREGNAPLPSEATEAYPVLHSLAQLTVTNKRKTDPQDELPAKVPKTDTNGDVKTASESIVPDGNVPEKEGQVEEEKMEVEESAMEVGEKENVDGAAASTETIIEDVTNTTEALDVPMVEVEPVTVEANEETPDPVKTEENMEAIGNTKVVSKPDEVKKSEDAVTKADGEDTKSEEKAVKPEEIVTKSDEVESKSDEGEIKSDEVLNKGAEAVESSEITQTNETSEIQETEQVENNGAKINEEEQEDESVESKEQIETPAVKEKDKIAEETPPTTVITEIEEITTENLGDVAEMIEDLEPIVEEPANEEMEDLQNVGEVLEKECDEILSKVQDVTNLDNIPLKPLLNTIAEETMETELDTENMDSNDIVERILDTELELEMKECNDIDPNIISEITDDAKMEESVDTKLADENKELKMITATEDIVTENAQEVSSTPQSMDTESSQLEPRTEDNKKDNEKIDNEESHVNIENETTAVENNDKVDKNDEHKSNDNVLSSVKEAIKDNVDPVESNEQNAEETKASDKVEIKDISETTVGITEKVESSDAVEETELLIPEEAKAKPSDNNKDDSSAQPQSTDTEMVPEVLATDNEKEKGSQVNGKETNGDAKTVNVNGDSNNVDELNSRLSVENGKEPLNGSNGDSVDAEKGQGDKMDAEVSDIKVKTVANEEPRTDPIEQPTEA